MTDSKNSQFVQNLILEINRLHTAVSTNHASIAARQAGFNDIEHQGDTKYVQTLKDLCTYEIENLDYSNTVINSIITKYSQNKDTKVSTPEIPYFLVTKLSLLLSKSVCIASVFSKLFSKVDLISLQQTLDKKNNEDTADNNSTTTIKPNTPTLQETVTKFDEYSTKYYEYVKSLKTIIETFDLYKINKNQQLKLISTYSTIKDISNNLKITLTSANINYIIENLEETTANKDDILQDLIDSLKKIREDITTNTNKIALIDKDVGLIKKLLNRLGGGSGGGGLFDFFGRLIAAGVTIGAIVAGLYIAKKALVVALTAVSVATKASYAAATASYYAKKARDFADDAMSYAKEALRIIKEYKKILDNHENRITILENKILEIDNLGDRTDNLENKMNDIVTQLNALLDEFNAFKVRYISWDYTTDQNYKIPPLCNTAKDYLKDITFGATISSYANQSELLAMELKETKIKIEDTQKYKEELLTYLTTNKSSICEITLKALKDTIVKTIETSPKDIKNIDLKSLISNNIRKIAIDKWVYVKNPTPQELNLLKTIRTLWWNIWEKKQISIVDKTKDTKHDYYNIKLSIIDNKTNTIIKHTEIYEKQILVKDYLPKLTSTQTMSIHINPLDIDIKKDEDTITDSVTNIPLNAFTIDEINQFISTIKALKIQDIQDFTYTKPFYLNLETCNTEDKLKLDKNKKKFLQILDYPFIINFIFNYEQILGLDKLKTDYKNMEELLQSEQDAQNKIEQDAQKNIKLLQETNTNPKIES